MECRRLVFLSTIFLLMNLFTGKIYAQEFEAPIEENAPEESVEVVEEAAPIEEVETIEEAAQENYYITRDEHKKIKFIQRLSWQEIPDIKNYKIQIQKYENEEYTDVFATDLNENYIEVSLEAGFYRFQVSVINLFDKETKSVWQEFEVLKALQPQIRSIEPKPLYLNKKADGVFTLGGENLFERTSFILRRTDKKGAGEELAGTVLSVDKENNTVQVQFDAEKLAAGTYEIFALNPGGLNDTSAEITAKNQMIGRLNVQFSAGYTLPIIVYDGTFEKYAATKILPISATAKVAVLAPIGKSGGMGLGLDAKYSFINTKTDVYTLEGNLATAMALFVIQKPFLEERLVLDVHAGAGMSYLFNTQFKYTQVEFTSPSFSALGLAFGGGFAVQYYPGKKRHFFVQAGADFLNSKFSDMNFGAIYPALSVGGKF